MDIRIYFQKIRDLENTLSTPFVVVSSLDTPDGGKEGMLTEVPRAVAAQLIVERKARLATEVEVREYREREERERAEAERNAANARPHFTLLTEQESRALRIRQKS
jgi:hypothetical protein